MAPQISGAGTTTAHISIKVKRRIVMILQKRISVDTAVVLSKEQASADAGGETAT
jgi:hypothetical protein